MNIADLGFLAVDDHEFQRNLLRHMLLKQGARRVATASDGKAALLLMQAKTPAIDIIVTDLDMPDMDGMEFIRHLGESANSVSVVVASALDASLLASIETMARAYKVNILGVIQKPVTMEKLSAVLRLHDRRKPPPLWTDRTSRKFTVEEIALGFERDEFIPYFQPKVSLSTGHLLGAEALARWKHGAIDSKIIPPSAFIDAMEANGMINQLTQVMLTKSAEFYCQWRAKNDVDITVSVNLSAKSLTDPNLADHLTALVRSRSVEPRSIVFELTESAAATNLGPALENLSRLRMKGFGLSIDDYGTGYSSMQQLTRVPFTELKIDQSFVTNAGQHQSASVILESSLDMARKLGITAVAEGVETRGDWDLLRHLGCGVAQGYFIARPMSAQAFLDWMSHGGDAIIRLASSPDAGA